MHLSCVHLATLKIHSVSQTPLNFEQKILPEVVHNSRDESRENPIPVCVSWDASMGPMVTRQSGVAQ